MMRFVDINDQYIIKRLLGFEKSFNSLNYDKLEIDNRDPLIDKHYGTSKEYLEDLMKSPQNGWPLSINGIDLASYINPSKPWKKLTFDITNNFTRELGAQQNALCCYYPSDGFIGWHDNHNAPGHTLLFTWSKNGDGYFRYRDKKTGEIITMWDKPGWTCKTGKYGDGSKEDPSQWHCAMTNEPRWSIAFYIRSQSMIDMIVEDIEYSDS